MKQPTARYQRVEVTRPYTVEIIEAEIALRQAADDKTRLATKYRKLGQEVPEQEWTAAYDRHREALEHLVSIKYY